MAALTDKKPSTVPYLLDKLLLLNKDLQKKYYSVKRGLCSAQMCSTPKYSF